MSIFILGNPNERKTQQTLSRDDNSEIIKYNEEERENMENISKDRNPKNSLLL